MATRSAAPSLEDYFYQEAKEKCYEIEIKGLKEFEKEKKRLVEAAKTVVREDVEKRLKQREIESKIARSTRINETRLRKMEARNQVLLRIIDEAEVALAERVKEDHTFYRALLKKLIMQSLVKLLEPVVVVRCLKRDLEMVQGLIGECAQEYKDFIHKELDIEKTVDISIDTHSHLEERTFKGLNAGTFAKETTSQLDSHRISKTDETRKCFGGVLITNDEHSIVCKNTIDARIELCFQESLPDIRKALFPNH